MASPALTTTDWEATGGAFPIHDDEPEACERCAELGNELAKARALLRMLVTFAPKAAQATAVDADPLELQIIGIESGLAALRARYGFFLGRKS